jgi:large subunit ribosomal protein L23
MDPHQVIIRPVISEKSYNLIETVQRVNTVNVKSKPKRQGLTRGRTPTWKKAVVKLAEGERIELFEGV